MSAGPAGETLSAEERRALALAKLARVFGARGGGSDKTSGDRAAEAAVLREVLRRTSQKEVAALVQDRLSVLSALNAPNSASDSDSNSDSGGDVIGAPSPQAPPHSQHAAPAASSISRPRAHAAPPTVTSLLRELASNARAVPAGLLHRSLWEELAGASLNAGGGAEAAAGVGPGVAGPTSGPRLRWSKTGARALLQDGYCVLPAEGCGGGGDDNVFPAIAATMRALVAAGWPPVFIFMYDELWQLLGRLFDVAAELLSAPADDVLLEASFFAWALQPPGAAPARVGSNFGLPHRDYSHADAIRGDGSIRLLSVWLPVTDATLDNGCLYVLPKPADALWAEPSHPAHMRCAADLSAEGGGGGPPVLELRFPLHAVRPLPAKAGSVLAWAGNTVHWGAACSPAGAAQPRQSVALTFRAGEAAPGGSADACGELYLSREETASGLSLERRFQLCCRALLLYSQWFDMPTSILPAAFWAHMS
eukprot:jgi/Tetstr1/435905/TSEL_024791.t1